MAAFMIPLEFLVQRQRMALGLCHWRLVRQWSPRYDSGLFTLADKPPVARFPTLKCSVDDALDNIREVVLGLAKIEAAGQEDNDNHGGRNRELAPRDRASQASGPEGGDQPGH